jgi:hypothetical protein
MTQVAAFTRNGRLDVLAANHLGFALYGPVLTKNGRPVNLARYVFLDPRARSFHADRESIAAAAVGSLRAEAARDPYDPPCPPSSETCRCAARTSAGNHDEVVYAASYTRGTSRKPSRALSPCPRMQRRSWSRATTCCRNKSTSPQPAAPLVVDHRSGAQQVVLVPRIDDREAGIATRVEPIEDVGGSSHSGGGGCPCRNRSPGGRPGSARAGQISARRRAAATSIMSTRSRQMSGD